jgi:hypothetical protein
VVRANEQLRVEGDRVKQRIEMLEKENRRLSEANEVMKRAVGEVSDCCPKVKKDVTNLERELAKLKEEIRIMRPKADPLAPPGADVAVPLGPKPATPAQTSANSSQPPYVAPPRPEPSPAKVSPPGSPTPDSSSSSNSREPPSSRPTSSRRRGPPPPNQAPHRQNLPR